MFSLSLFSLKILDTSGTELLCGPDNTRHFPWHAWPSFLV